MPAEFEWNPNQPRDHGRFAPAAGASAAPAGPSSAADGSTKSERRKARAHTAASVAAEGQKAAAALASADAALKKAGPVGARARKQLRKAVSYLATAAVNAAVDLATLTTATGHLDSAIEKRYGATAARAITAAAKGTTHVIGVDKMPPTQVIPGTTLLKKLPFLAVAEVVRLFRSRPKPPKPLKSKTQDKAHKKAMHKKAVKIFQKRVKSEIGKAFVPKRVKLKVELSADTVLSDALVAKVLARVKREFAGWTAARAGELAADFAPLAGVKFSGPPAAFYHPDQPRDHGRFAPGDGGAAPDAKGAPGQQGPAAAPATARPAAAPPATPPAAQAVVAKLDRAKGILQKAGAAGVRGTKHLTESVSFLITRAGRAVSDLDATIDERYGHRPGMAIKAFGKAVGDIVPKMGGDNFVPDLEWEAVPAGDLLCTLPVVAIAELTRQVYKLFRPDAPPEPVRSKSHEKRLAREAVQKGNTALKKKAKSLGFDPKKNRLKLSDLTAKFADDEVPADVTRLAHAAARRVLKQYAEWLRARLPRLRRDLAPLARADFADRVDAARACVAEMSRALADGGVTLPEWTGRFSAILQALPHRAAGVVWGHEPPPFARRLAEAQARAAAAHVALFAERLDAGEEDWGPATAARADLYTQAAFSDLEEQRRTAARASGADEEKRECADECRDCAECREKAEFGWRPVCSLPPAGDCPCATRCRCTFRFRAGARAPAPDAAG